LKDAASAAIYGARASNGVVLITTKRGKANRSGVSFNTYVGFTRLANTIDVLDAQQYKDLMTERGETIDPAFNANTDWQEETFGTGINQNYQLAFTGGGTNTQYYMSLGYLKDKGMVEPARFDRYSARLNVDHKVTNWLKIGANINYIRSITKNAGDNASSGRGGIIMSALNTPPIMSIMKDDGSGEFTQNPFQASWETPLSYMSRDEKTRDNRLLANLNTDVRLFPGLNYRMNLGTDISNSNYDFYVDPLRTVFGRQNHGVANIGRSDYFSWLWENTLTYTKKFGYNNLTALVGMSAQENNWGTAYVNTIDLPVNGVQTTNAGNQIQSAGNTKTVSSIVSQFSRFIYDYDSRYLFTAAFRRDGSSKLAEGNKWDFFPSFSAGWRISRESFFQNVNGINDLKLRVGWGQTGNQEGLSDFASMGLLNFERQTPGTPLNGPAIKRYTIANPDLRWEKTTQANVGIDLTFLNERITFTADAYWKTTKDLILAIPLPSSTGVEQPFSRNDGELENKGFEFSVSSKNVTGSNFSWNTDFNISFNKNKVTKLGLQKIYDFAGIYSNGQNVIRVIEGQELGMFYGYVSNGVDPATGMIVYEDINKNGFVTPDDRTVIGYAAPKFTYGMTNTLSFKNFDLNIFIQGVSGNDVFNATRVDLEGMFDSKNQSVDVLNRWKNPGDVTDMPRAIPSSSGNIDNINNSTRFIENGSFLRLKSATLAYNLPQSFTQRLKLQKASFYITGQNLFTITDYSGFDPEVNTYGVNSRGTEFGVDYGTYPQTRQIVFGVNIDF
jgi:TonB-linked SusC/RagA family outer membrane protein